MHLYTLIKTNCSQAARRLTAICLETKFLSNMKLLRVKNHLYGKYSIVNKHFAVFVYIGIPFYK